MSETNNQYETSRVLQTRIDLHGRYSLNPQGWFDWLRNLVEPELSGRVLDVGCGTGAFWESSSSDHSRYSEVILVDSSEAMIANARGRLGGTTPFQFRTADAQNMPFGDEYFDCLTAFHMLYDVPDIQAALTEFARVTRPGGRVIISTNGRNHLRELDELVAAYIPEASWSDIPTRFTLEDVEAALHAVFKDVEVHRYPDELWVTDADALTNWASGVPGAHDLRAFHTAVVELIHRNSGIHVTKDSGCFIQTR